MKRLGISFLWAIQPPIVFWFGNIDIFSRSTETGIAYFAAVMVFLLAYSVNGVISK